MRSFIAFLACTGFIVWAHSCDKRIVGVKIYANKSGEDLFNDDRYSSNDMLYRHPYLFANAQQPVALDALFVDVPYEHSLYLYSQR
ncbi:hypothetical protein [Chitinophaga agri]|uniref:Uncharacterized protein n=1 Tax=Chitinophaga agri TaxID=2703787 RepID=A0A6B9ZKA2_9BACT|nr:hypothetical protein [Chitinophaga agri]QHS61824.1 hypothetical protein GWR21_20125 [Chitinophaga agri]